MGAAGGRLSARLPALLLTVLGALFVPVARGQSTGAHVLRGLDAVDSMVAAEYAKDSVGSVTVGVVSAGEPYVAWERSQVLEPLGMLHTRFAVDSSIAGDLTLGDDVQRDGTLDAETAQREARTGRGYKVPNGAIFTSVDDLARFVSFGLGRAPERILPHAAAWRHRPAQRGGRQAGHRSYCRRHPRAPLFGNRGADPGGHRSPREGTGGVAGE